MDSCYGRLMGSSYGDTATVNGCHSLFANNRTPVFYFVIVRVRVVLKRFVE